MESERLLRSESNGVERICAILAMDSRYGIFVLDLDDHADAGANPIVNLHNPSIAGFVRKDPNILLENFKDACFCGRDGIIYIFEGLTSKREIEIYDSSSPLGVYGFLLSAHISKLNNHVVYKRELDLYCSLKGPKLLPNAVQCSRGIVIFSTEIEYGCDSSNMPSDFELFIPERRMTIRLPQLRILRREETRSLFFAGGPVEHIFHFYLLKTAPPVGQEVQVLMPRYPRQTAADELARTSFSIIAFSVNGHDTLIVQTDLGVVFSLNLELPHQQWQVFEGSAFPHFHQNFLMDDNGLVLSPSGASRFSYDGYGCSSDSSGGGGGGVRACVPFPLCSFASPNPLWRNFAIGLPERSMYPLYTPCILQVGFDHYEQPYWTLDVVKIDVSKFEEEEEGGDQFARRIQSFKFLSGCCGSIFFAECLYPF